MSPGTAGRGMGARDAFPRLPEQAGATIPSFPQRSQVGWGQPHSQPCLGAVAARAEPPCTGSCSSSPPRCSQGLLRHLLPAAWAEVGTKSSVTARLAQQPGQQRHGEQQVCLEAQAQAHSRARNEHRTQSMLRACRALPQPLCPARAQAGWGGCARLGQLGVPTAPVPLLAPRGTPSTHLSHSSRRPSPGLASGPARGCPAPP